MSSFDGRPIPYILECSRQTPSRGVFLLLHGLGVDKNEYQGFYSKAADFFVSAGFDVLRIDFPAHGESGAAPSMFSLLNCIADAIVAARFATTRSHTLSVFGTSFGAGPAVVAASAFREVLSNVTLLAPALSYRELYIHPTHPVRVAKYQTFFEDAILRGECIPIGERLQLNWRNALEFDVVDLEYHLSVIAKFTAILHGDADSMVPHALSQALKTRIPTIDLTIVPGMDHGFMDYDDETGTGAQSRRNLKLILEKAVR